MCATRPRGTQAHACGRQGAYCVGAPAPSARRTRARRTHPPRLRPSRASDNAIGDEGAQELAAALEANTTITTLDLNRACRDPPSHNPPRDTAAHAHACRGRDVRRAPPRERTRYLRHALLAHTARASPPACRRQ